MVAKPKSRCTTHCVTIRRCPARKTAGKSDTLKAPESAGRGIWRNSCCGSNGLEMSVGPDRSNWYLQGIRRAEQDGLIDYARKNIDNQSLIPDDYGHICHGDEASLLLKYTNTRPLSFIARQILNLYRTEPNVRFLELGPGAGVACTTINRLLPHAKIDTVSLTPINPYLRFLWDNMYDHIADRFVREKDPLRLYSSCCRPFVSNQYIGRFPGQVHLQKENYHFIYEDHGALFYNFHPNGNDESMELARASVASALSLLRQDGTMLIMASDGAHRMEDALESFTTGADVIVTCKRAAAYHSFPCIVAKKQSPLSMRLRQDESGLLSKSERVLRLDLETLEKVISKICACDNES